MPACNWLDNVNTGTIFGSPTVMNIPPLVVPKVACLSKQADHEVYNRQSACGKKDRDHIVLYHILHGSTAICLGHLCTGSMLVVQCLLLSCKYRVKRRLLLALYVSERAVELTETRGTRPRV